LKETGSNQRIPKKPKFGNSSTGNKQNHAIQNKKININHNSSKFSSDDSEDSEWNEEDDKVVTKSKINKRKSPKRGVKSEFKI
jgi:hypothetical protein